jgi:hypothetical protein
MTVSQLIARLKKLDQKAIVAWRDHDQSENEVNGFVRSIEEATQPLLTDPYIRGVLDRYEAHNVVVLGP